MNVLRGSEGLTAATVREAEALAKNGATPDQRLGCQCEVTDTPGELLVTTGYW
jgi:ferredoxin